MRGSRGGGGGLKNHKAMGFLSNPGPDLLKYQNNTKPAFNVGPMMAHFFALFGFSFPPSTENWCQKWTIAEKIFWIRQ